MGVPHSDRGPAATVAREIVMLERRRAAPTSMNGRVR